MRKMTRFLCAVAVAAALSACGPKKPEALVFSAGGAPAEVAVFKELAARYSALSGTPQVELRALPADSDLQLQAYRAALGSGRAPYDVMRLDGIWLADFDAQDWLQPLDALLPKALPQAFGPLLDSADRLNGKLLALPWNVDLGLLYSRSDLLKAVGAKGPPKTRAELERLAQAALGRAAAQGQELEGIVWQGKAYEGLTCNFLEAYAAAGGDPKAVGRDGVWQSAPATRALQQLRRWVHGGLSPANTPTELTEEESRLLFQSGRAVFMRNWPYAAPLLQQADSKVKGKVWVSPMPGGSTVGGWHLAVRKGSPFAKESAAFVAWLCSKPIQAELAQRLGWNPSREDAYAALDPKKAPQLAAVRDALKQALSRPQRQAYASFSEHCYQTVNQVLLGQITPEQGAVELAKP